MAPPAAIGPSAEPTLPQLHPFAPHKRVMASTLDSAVRRNFAWTDQSLSELPSTPPNHHTRPSDVTPPVCGVYDPQQPPGPNPGRHPPIRETAPVSSLRTSNRVPTPTRSEHNLDHATRLPPAARLVIDVGVLASTCRTAPRATPRHARTSGHRGERSTKKGCAPQHKQRSSHGRGAGSNSGGSLAPA